MTQGQTFIPPSPINTAVLFLVFNRPDTTRQVFEAIRQAKPLRLYVAADGPRPNRPGEAERCEEVRRIATNVDWPCEVKTLLREQNLGCKKAVGTAISWFFENEAQGIILEDDCLPHPDFFHFCDALLERYKDDPRVWVITGNNFQNGIKRGDASYYFSRYNHVWGWATWRRAWQFYDGELSFWPTWKRSEDWLRKLPDKIERRYWSVIFDRMYAGEIDTWDYSWTATVWYHGSLTVTPNANLVTNIGFGGDATHTKSKQDPNANLPVQPLGPLVHLSEIIVDKEADRYTFDHVFGGRWMRFPWNVLNLPRKVVRKLQRIIAL